MDGIRLLENPIRHYAWGSRTFLAQLQGRPVPTPEPEAELWIGAHPSAPSRVATEEGSVPLSDWIAGDPEAVLGRRVAARFGGALPFLLKVLAVEEPLSLQVHPDAARAREGFQREHRAGTAIDAPQRCYRDPHAKPELICALTRFEALIGLRPVREVRAAFESLGVPTLRKLAVRLRQAPATDAAALRETFVALLALAGPERAALVAQVAEVARLRSDSGPADAWFTRLAELWPDDPMALAPYLLHHIRLAPGEALFVAPGTLHAYLTGAAVEVQAPSDNVLRAGLTHKHVEVEALLSAAEFQSRAPCTAQSTGGADARVYHTPTPEFELTSMRLGADERRQAGTRAVEILLCAEGGATLTNSRDGRLHLGPGQAALVPAAVESYGVRGPAHLFRVRAGEA